MRIDDRFRTVCAVHEATNWIRALGGYGLAEPLEHFVVEIANPVWAVVAEEVIAYGVALSPATSGRLMVRVSPENAGVSVSRS